MKKFLMALAVIAMTIVGANALTFKEAFDEIKAIPDLKGVVSEDWNDISDGWVGSMMFDNVSMALKAHQVGGAQTVYYGGKIMEVVNRLPADKLILSGSNDQNLFYIFAEPAGDNSSEVLMIVDQAYQGKTTAILGRVNNQVINSIRGGHVTFADHSIIVNAPVLICR